MLRTVLALATAVGVGWLIYRQERLMADFTNLNAKLDQVGGIVTNLKSEWQTLKDQLANDSTDQAAVDAATARVDGLIGDLGSVDLVPDATADQGDTPAETSPAAGDQA